MKEELITGKKNYEINKKQVMLNSEMSATK